MTIQTAMSSMFAIFSLLAFNACVLGNKEPDEVLRALNQYKKSQNWFEKFSIHMVAIYRQTYPENESEPSGKTEVTIKKMGSFLSISGELLSRKNAPDKTLMVVNNKMGMSLFHGVHEKPTNAIVTANTKYALDRNITDPLLSGAILEGYMLRIDGKCLADLMLEANNSTILGNESINGRLCLKISSKTPYGSIELWLDERNGHLPRKYAFKRDADDLCSAGKKLCESNFYGTGRGHLTGVFTNRIYTVLDQVEIGEEAGIFFIRNGRITDSGSLSNGNTFSSEYIYKRTKFDPTPLLSEDDFRIDLPNGMRINNEDDLKSGVAYEWQDGRIAPAYSDFSASTTEGKWVNKSAFLVLIWLGGGILLLAASLWYVWRYKTARG